METYYDDNDGTNETTQLSINNTEANHRSLFVAGWRPAFGWLGVITCTFDWIIKPLITMFVPNTSNISMLTPDILWIIITGLLGVSGLRSCEKFKGVTK